MILISDFKCIAVNVPFHMFIAEERKKKKQKVLTNKFRCLAYGSSLSS